MKENSLAAGIDPDCKDASDAENHVFNLPSLMPYRSPEGSFQVHQDEDRTQKHREVKQISRPAQWNQPYGVGIEDGFALENISPENRDQGNGDDEGGRNNPPPFQNDFPVIDPAVGQSKEEPHAGDHGLIDQPDSMPIQYPIGVKRLETDPPITASIANRTIPAAKIRCTKAFRSLTNTRTANPTEKERLCRREG
jgi:hypothetical protein